jgi:hypothetical protein
VILSLGRYLCWGTISPGGIIRPVVSDSITGSIPLSPSSGIDPVIESLTTGWMIPPGLIVPQQRDRPSDRITDYRVDDTPGTWGTISRGGIIHPVVSDSITGSIPLLGDY